MKLTPLELLGLCTEVALFGASRTIQNIEGERLTRRRKRHEENEQSNKDEGGRGGKLGGRDAGQVKLRVGLTASRHATDCP